MQYYIITNSSIDTSDLSRYTDLITEVFLQPEIFRLHAEKRSKEKNITGDE